MTTMTESPVERRRAAERELAAGVRIIAKSAWLLDLSGCDGIRIVTARDVHSNAGGSRKRQSFAPALTGVSRAGIAHLRRSGTETIYSRYGNAFDVAGGTPGPGEMLDVVWARLDSNDPVVVADRATAVGSDLLAGRLELGPAGFSVDYDDLGVELVTRIGNLRDVRAVLTWLFADRQRRSRDG